MLNAAPNLNTMSKILIVDDSNDLLEILQYFLEDAGHTVATIDSASQIHKQLEGFKPDIILLDVFLKKDNGREICRELKDNENSKKIPIILMSAHDKNLENSKECGADETLAKPFDLNDIIEKIKRVLNVAPVFISPLLLGTLLMYL